MNTRSPDKHCPSAAAGVTCPVPTVTGELECLQGFLNGFAVLCLWLECSCLSVVLETVYINHTNNVFIRNGPLNRII